MNPTDPTQRQPLRLADHVRACALADQVVLLDLRRSRYLSVSRDHGGSLTCDSATPSRDRPAGPCTSALPCSRSLIQALLRRGLLTRLPPRQVGSTPVPPAARSWARPDAGALPAVGALRTWRLLCAATWAASTLRLRSLDHIAGTTFRRTARLQHPQADKHALLEEAVAAFHALRPLLFTSRDRCLQDSLTLVSFLASEGIAARWVIGVRSQPVGAHAWAQAGGLVLNDQHENVRHSEPILVV